MAETQYETNNRWVLFKNDRKTKPTDADYTGTLNIEGAEYWLNAWSPKTPGGKMVLSGSIKSKNYKGTPTARPAPAATTDFGSRYADDDEAPF